MKRLTIITITTIALLSAASADATPQPLSRAQAIRVVNRELHQELSSGLYFSAARDGTIRRVNRRKWFIGASVSILVGGEPLAYRTVFAVARKRSGRVRSYEIANQYPEGVVDPG